jgi:tRNA(Ile)-lysidine synthase
MLAKSDCNQFIRPLLSISKLDLQQYMETNNYIWYNDSSNLSKVYKRNKIRLDLIPLMTEISGGENALKCRFNSLVEQSLSLRKWIDIESSKYIDKYLNNINSNIIEIDISVNSSYLKLSELVQMEVICNILKLIDNNFVIDYKLIKHIQKISINNNENGTKSKQINIENISSIIQIGNVMRFINLKEKFNNDNDLINEVINEYKYNENDCNIQINFPKVFNIYINFS